MKPTLHSFTLGSRLTHWKQLLLASLCVTAIHAGSAQTIYKTGFDKPFIAGAPLNGQDGWVAPPPLSANAAVVTEEKPHIGRQTVEVRGADLVPQSFINAATGGYYDAIGSYRRAVNHDTGGTQTVTVSAFVRVDGVPSPAGNNFFSASIAARASLTNGDHAGVGELAISSDGHVYGYSGNENVPTFQTSKPVTLGKWHLLSIEINFATQTYSFRVNAACRAMNTADSLSSSFANPGSGTSAACPRPLRSGISSRPPFESTAWPKPGDSRAAVAVQRVAVDVHELAVDVRRGAVGVQREAVDVQRMADGVERVGDGVERVAVGVERDPVGVKRVSVGVERVSVGAERVAVGVERVSVHAERVAVGVERVPVGLERVEGRKPVSIPAWATGPGVNGFSSKG